MNGFVQFDPLGGIKILKSEFLPATRTEPRFKRAWVAKILGLFGVRVTKEVDCSGDFYKIAPDTYVVHPKGYEKVESALTKMPQKL